MLSLTEPFFLRRKWRHWVPPKHLYPSTKLYGTTSQNIIISRPMLKARATLINLFHLYKYLYSFGRRNLGRKCACHCFGCDVWNRDDFWPSSEVVNCSEAECVSCWRWKRSTEAYVNVKKTGWWSNSVAGDFIMPVRPVSHSHSPHKLRQKTNIPIHSSMLTKCVPKPGPWEGRNRKTEHSVPVR
jgi:hypothetical protein